MFLNKEKLDFKDEENLNFINEFSNEIPKILLYSDFTFEVPKAIHFYTTDYKNRDEGHLTIINKDKKKNPSNKEWQNILQDITDSLYQKDNISFQKDIVDYLDGAEGGSVNNFRDKLSGISTHINAKITKKWIKNLKDKLSLKEIRLICDDTKTGVDKRNFSFNVISKDNNTFDLVDRSKGCKWFFAFMIFTEFRKYRKDNTIFLLDEPASNLHGLIQERVIESIGQLCDKSSIIYTTHSPYLIDINYIETIFSVRNVNSNSEVKPAKIEINPYKSETGIGIEEEKPITDHIKLNLKKYIPTSKNLYKKYSLLKNIYHDVDIIERFLDLFK